VAGGTLIASRRHLPRISRNVATLAGLALVGVAAYRPLAELIRQAGGRRRTAGLRLSFRVERPVERVFAFCRDFENFPRFVGALRTVRDYGDGRSRWCASTPSGGTVEWNAITTKYVPNRVIAWATLPGSPVHATGLMRFRREGDSTCLEVVLTYEPAAPGGMRDAIAALVTPPRARQLELDLAKLVDYLSTAPDRELAAYGA
jgi:uncharacterized membrane protein